MDLTETELKVLEYVVMDMTSREIADHMGRSVKTIQVHRNNIHRKLGVHKATELVKYAIEEKLI